MSEWRTAQRVYLSGPMTGIPEYNYPLFESSAAWLRETGYEVVSPHEVNPLDGVVRSWDWYMRRDIPGLVTCDAVVVLPGWEASKGAALEVHIARTLGMPVWAIEAVEPPEVMVWVR